MTIRKHRAINSLKIASIRSSARFRGLSTRMSAARSANPWLVDSLSLPKLPRVLFNQKPSILPAVRPNSKPIDQHNPDMPTQQWFDIQIARTHTANSYLRERVTVPLHCTIALQLCNVRYHFFVYSHAADIAFVLYIHE